MYIGDKDFYQQINDQFRLTTVQIIYRMPDYLSLLQEYVWQTIDIPPTYPRIYKFLDYWEKNIEGPIYSVKIANIEVIKPNNFRSINKIYEIKPK